MQRLTIVFIFFFVVLPINGAEQLTGDKWQQIQDAWNRRREATPSITMKWTMSAGDDSVAPDAPRDRDGQHDTFTVYVHNDSFRTEKRVRYYDLDGVSPRSRSWQTSITTRTFNPNAGWRELCGSDAPAVLPTSRLGVPLGFVPNVLTLEQLFQVWYRGNINAGGPQGANPWEAASDPALAFPTPTLYSICQKIGSQLVVLGLDSERGFLPTASKMYRKNGDGWLKHSEFVVALDDALSTALVPVPRTIDQYRFRLGKLDGEPFQMVLDSVIWEAPDDQSFYEVPFPKTVSPNDLSPQKSILIGGPSVRQPGGYSVWQWFALLFTVVLSVSAFVRYKRTHSS